VIGDGGTDGGNGDGGLACTTNPMCPAAMPICAQQDHTCRGCIADDECDSVACLPDGSCAAASRVLYAAPAGTGTACSLAQRCTVDTAVGKLATGVDVIELAPGIYEQTAQLAPVTDMILLGNGAASLHSAAAASLIMWKCFAIASTFYKVVIDAEAGIGVECAMNGKIAVLQSTFTRALVGVISGPCDTTIDRSWMTTNTSYGMLVNGGTALSVTNNFVTKNGSTGGMLLYNLPATGVVEHNTVAGNTGPGMKCMGAQVASVRNNIVFANVIDATCTVIDSDVDPAYAGGSGNVKVDPLFMDATANNYHLAPGSPVKGLADALSATNHDFDGEPRPQPPVGAPDLGADEIP
jgi:hypothetical protein